MQTSTTESLDLSDLSRRVEAEEYRGLGHARHAAGDVEEAAAYYQMSLDIYPTAEAYTALGVTLAGRGQWDEAIALCEQAIALEPDLGNPYNDMGVYLEQKGESDQALACFDRALAASHYDCRNYPHYHKGRIFEQMGRFGEARDAYYQSLQIDPEWPPAITGYRRALGWLN